MIRKCHGMALQALHGLGYLQQAPIGGAVGVVADGAIFYHGGMLEYLGTTDGLVAFEALFILAQQGGLLAVMGLVAAHA